MDWAGCESEGPLVATGAPPGSHDEVKGMSEGEQRLWTTPGCAG